MNDFFIGDSWTITLNLTNEDTTPKDLTGATLTFRLVQNFDCEALIQQNFTIDPDPLLGVATITIPTTETSKVENGLNWVSIEIDQASEIKTIYQERLQFKKKVKSK